MNRNPSGWPTPSYVKSPQGWAWPTPQVTHSTPNFPVGVSRTINSAAEELLATAVAWWDTSKYVAGDRFLRNLGYGGPGLDARLGSNINPNSNDPTYLPWNNFNYLFIPDSNSSLTCVAPATAASYVAYRLDETTATGAVTGGATFTFSTSGSWTKIDLLDSSSTVVASFDANTGTFVYSSTTTLAVAATAINTTITVASATNIKIGSLIQIGIEQMLVTAITGNLVTVTRGANGSTAAIQAINSGIFMSAVYTDSFAVEWSLNRPNAFNQTQLHRKKAVFVVRPTFVLGTDDYFEVTGNQQQLVFTFGPNQPFTVFASYISHEPAGQAANNGALLFKGSGGGAVGWNLGSNGVNSTFGYEDRTGFGIQHQVNSNPSPARGEPITHFGRRAKNIGTILGRNDSVSIIPTQQVVAGNCVRRDSKNTPVSQARSVNPEPEGVGEIFSFANFLIGAGTSFCTMEFLGAAVFRKPLTNTEMDLISRYYGSL